MCNVYELYSSSRHYSSGPQEVLRLLPILGAFAQIPIEINMAGYLDNKHHAATRKKSLPQTKHVDTTLFCGRTEEFNVMKSSAEKSVVEQNINLPTVLLRRDNLSQELWPLSLSERVCSCVDSSQSSQSQQNFIASAQNAAEAHLKHASEPGSIVTLPGILKEAAHSIVTKSGELP